MSRSIKPERISRDLEEVAAKLFDEVRRDTGNFETGACVLNGKRILLVNSRQPIDERVAALAKVISRQGIESLYIKPALREEIERWAPSAPTRPDVTEDGWNQTC